jgi:hypothetical protein
MQYKTVYFVTYARLPGEIPASEQYMKLAIGAEIDIVKGIILNTSATLPSELAKSMVNSYICNKNIVKDLDQMVDEIQFRHQGEVQKALVKAIVEINKKYLRFIDKHKIKTDY